MNKEVKYNGYSAQPSDYECQDGPLTTSINLIAEDGAIHPIALPMPMFNPGRDSIRALYIHKTSSFTHYILFDEEYNDGYWFSWIDSNDIDPKTKHLKPDKSPVKFYSIKSNDNVAQIEAIGNTLIILAEDSLNYFLWKDENYLFLGNRLPEINLSFGLQVDIKFSDVYNMSTDGLPNDDNRFNDFTSDPTYGAARRDTMTQRVLGQVNRYISENQSEGKFLMPFFVRYALRLYDGSLTMHSSPVLMIPATAPNPTVMAFYFTHDGYPDRLDTAVCRTAGLIASLDYRSVIPESEIAAIRDKWSDIISSVDIFISKPIYIYDQNGYVNRINGHNLDNLNVYGAIGTGAYAVGSFNGGAYGKIQFTDLWSIRYGAYEGASFDMPQRDDDAIKRDIESNSLFYFLKSYKLDELKTKRSVIDIPKDYLTALVTREVMTDDYDSHDTLMPSMMYSYNSRLNLAGGKKKLFGNLGMSDLSAYTGISENEITGNSTTCTPLYCIKQDGREITIHGKGDILCTDAPFPSWLYFPNTNATKVILRTGSRNYTYYELELKKHSFLNGSYYFGGIISSYPVELVDYSLPEESTEDEKTVSLANKVYTSQVNNPFCFPVESINSVGTGTILAMCTAAKALSQGQFGQFPLYAFTTEGVWAMEVSSAGTYSARQPITRDVCINPSGITQLDSAVLFPTDRGIMLISGSQTECITDMINTEYPFDVSVLPGFSSLHKYHHPDIENCIPTLPFSEFLNNCRMIYDYSHQRVIVYNPNIAYAYVFSLKSKQWGMMYSTIAYHLNSYPEALAVDSNKNTIVNFSEVDDEKVDGILVTRPLKLDTPDILKTVDCIIQRGNFRKGHVQSILYASRDLVNWHLVWSSKDHFLRGFRGTPYKYFRVVLLCNLSPGESIFGASVQFTPRLTNQPR